MLASFGRACLLLLASTLEQREEGDGRQVCCAQVDIAAICDHEAAALLGVDWQDLQEHGLC